MARLHQPELAYVPGTSGNYRRRENPQHVARAYQLAEDLTQRYGVARECVIARAGDWEIETPGGLYHMTDADFVAEFEPAASPLEAMYAEYILTLLLLGKAPHLGSLDMKELRATCYYEAPHKGRKFLS